MSQLLGQPLPHDEEGTCDLCRRLAPDCTCPQAALDAFEVCRRLAADKPLGQLAAAQLAPRSELERIIREAHHVVDSVHSAGGGNG